MSNTIEVNTKIPQPDVLKKIRIIDISTFCMTQPTE